MEIYITHLYGNLHYSLYYTQYNNVESPATWADNCSIGDTLMLLFPFTAIKIKTQLSANRFLSSMKNCSIDFSPKMRISQCVCGYIPNYLVYAQPFWTFSERTHIHSILIIMVWIAPYSYRKGYMSVNMMQHLYTDRQRER